MAKRCERHFDLNFGLTFERIFGGSEIDLCFVLNTLQLYNQKYLSVCPFVRSSVCPSVTLSAPSTQIINIYLNMSVCQSVSLSVCQSVSLSVCQSVSLSVRLLYINQPNIFTSPYVCPSVYLSFHSVFFACLSIQMYFCLYI